jgi:hypothetical protein
VIIFETIKLVVFNKSFGSQRVRQGRDRKNTSLFGTGYDKMPKRRDERR